MDVVFCKTRWGYDSYTDFWSLVALSGFETVWLDELEPGREALYVLTPKNGELEGVLPRLQGGHKAKLVWWCLERPNPEGRVTESRGLPPGVHEIWMSDRYYAQLNTARFVPVGIHEGLGEPGHQNGYDWVHMSYENPRRRAVYDEILGACGPCSWGDERDRVLKDSRLMVNVHQDNHLMVEPLRLTLATAYGLPVFGEAAICPTPYIFEKAPYRGLAARVNEVIKDAQRGVWRDFGLRMRDKLLRECTFGAKVVEAAYAACH